MKRRLQQIDESIERYLGQISSADRQEAEVARGKTQRLDADRGYFKGEEILACDQAGITTYLPKPQTSGSMKAGLFSKRDFIYRAEDDEYEPPAGERLIWRFETEEKGQKIHKYSSSSCPTCAIRSQCTRSKYRRVSRCEHEEVLEAVERRAGPAARANGRTTSDVGTSLRYPEGLDGFDLLPDEEVRERRYGDESPRAGLQPETRHGDPGNSLLDRSDAVLKKLV